MLDKSLQFHSIIMCCPNNVKPKEVTIPEGFYVRHYEEGDEYAWAKIQKSVLEFTSEEIALNVYAHYLKDLETLKARQIYVIDKKTNTPVATSTAWYTKLNGEVIGTVHGVSCLPEYQSLGLGKVAINEMMKIFYDLMPNIPIWLDTQTWSYKAVGLYLSMGFVPMKTAEFNEAKNEFNLAMEVMKPKLKEDVYKHLLELAQ